LVVLVFELMCARQVLHHLSPSTSPGALFLYKILCPLCVSFWAAFTAAFGFANLSFHLWNMLLSIFFTLDALFPSLEAYP
jgi:hypothetical protein